MDIATEQDKKTTVNMVVDEAEDLVGEEDKNVHVVVTPVEDEVPIEAGEKGSSKEKETEITDNDEGSDDPSLEKEKTPKVSKCAASDLYPPSFFTDDRGNLKFVNLVCRHPIKVFVAIIVICFILSAVVLYTVSQRRNRNPFSEPSREYEMSDVRSLAYDSLLLALEEVETERGEVLALSENAKDIRPQEENIDITYWAFESKTDEGLFGTRQSIEAMKEAFDFLTLDPEYESYCQKVYKETTTGENGTVTVTSECRRPLSPLMMYYASEWDEEQVQIVLDELQNPANILRYNFLGVCVEFDLFCSPFMDEEDLDWARNLHYNISNITDHFDGLGNLNANISQVTLLAAYMAELNTKRGLVDFGYDKNFSLTNQKSTYSRGIVFWGGPLNNRSVVGFYNRTEEEIDEDFLVEYFVETFLQDLKGIISKDYDPEVNFYYFTVSLLLDIYYDIAIRDGALAGFSFLFVFLYIRISLGSWFLAFVGLLEIFLSIPVSWFVFSMCFRIQYFSFLNALALFIVAAIGADDIFIFMDAYKQSATQISEGESYILESLESRMSWVYRRTGIAMGITSATTCLAFLCTLATPLVNVRAFGIFAALVILIDYALVMTLFCTAVVIYHNKFEKPGCCCCGTTCCNGGGCCQTTQPSPTRQAYENLISGETTVKSDKISQFFGTKMAGFILNAKGRSVCAVVLFSWLLVASIFSARLEPTKLTEQFLDESHPIQEIFTILNNEFPQTQTDPGLFIYFTWGLGGVDRTGVNLLLDPFFFGKAVFLDSFDLNEECQREMAQICDDLKTNKSYAPYIKQTDGLGTVKCFMDEFGAYSAVGSLDSCEIVRNGAWKQTDWTVPPEEFVPFMERFLEERSCRAGGNTSIINYYNNELGWNGTALKFAGITIENSVLDPFSAPPESVSREQYDAMMAISQDLDSRMQNKCGTKVAVTDLREIFTFMNNQNIYVESAVLSSLLGVCIAFVVLFISTRRLHIALLATLSIASVLISVTGIMVMIGWELGSIEGILISVVAGFSVDYVVHLAHSYESGRGDTETRIKKAFGEMGISVMNGMITSVCASIPLFFCQLRFFEKFGAFLCVIIAFSWIFANFGFMSVLAQLKIPIAKDDRRLCHI